MLASIIANLQNVVDQPAGQPSRPAKLPMVKIDRGGGGGPSWPSYDIVDIITATRLFPEIAGEDSLTRAARRTRWIGEVLPYVKEARERREGAAFLAGAMVADAAAQERHRAAEAEAEARRRLVDQLKIEQLVEIIDEVRGTPAPQPAFARGRYEASGTSGFAIAAALGIGVVLGVAIARRAAP